MGVLHGTPRLRRQGCACSQSRIACTLSAPVNEFPSSLGGEWGCRPQPEDGDRQSVLSVFQGWDRHEVSEIISVRVSVLLKCKRRNVSQGFRSHRNEAGFFSWQPDMYIVSPVVWAARPRC